MRSAFSLQVSATVVLCHVKLMSGVLSLEVREQMLCSGLCNSAATSIVYLFTSFLGSDVNVETRCIVHRVNIHILICTLNVRETSEDWQTGICNISCTSRGFCRVSPWDLENCSVCLRCSGSMWCIARKTYMCCFHSNYEQWTKKINNSGITAPFNFVWAARQWPRGDRRRMRKWHGCWKLWGASDLILETCRRMSSDTSIQMNIMWF